MNSRCTFLPGILILAGCYVHQPIAPDVVPATETRVSVALTDLGTVRMGERLGPGIGWLEGRFVRSSGDTVFLLLDRTISRDRLVTTWLGDTTAVPRPLVSAVAVRALDRRRTLAAIVGAAVLGVSVIGGINAIGGGDNGDGGSPPPGSPAIRLP